MRSDALEIEEHEEPLETEAGASEPAWTLAPGVDLDSDDPAAVEGRTRQCVALTKAGARCSAPALTSDLVCSAHAGLLDASAGGLARAQKLRLVREEAQERAVEAAMGTRATIAAALREKHAEIRLAVHGLADRAADGDRQAALALLPFVTQALGTPSPSGPDVVRVEGESVDLSALDTASLKALLAAQPSP
jgi:hypothetical protein